MKKILFVCTGNTCRSPMAEAIFNHLTKSSNAFSRGINTEDGLTISEHSAAVLIENGIDASGFAAKNLTKEDILEADVIYTMTRAQKTFIENNYNESHGKVFTLNTDNDIIDPYMGDKSIYQATYQEIYQQIKKIIERNEV